MGTFMVNHTISVTLEVVNEGVVLVAKAGSDPELALNIIKTSSARSAILDRFSTWTSPLFPTTVHEHGHGY